MLSVTRTGSGPTVVLVHGFTQTGQSWQPVVERLERIHRFILVDAPGHGASAAIQVDLGVGAELLGATGGRAAYAGYSMGGRLCLHLALARPDLVDRLVLIGAHPGIVDAGERSCRQANDERLARRLLSEGVPAFVSWWLSQPLFCTLAADQAGREDRLPNTAEGLAASLRLAGTGSQEPLWGRLGELDMPVLVVAGERDHTYALLSREMVDAIGRNAELVLIPGAGHACHLERPDAFCLVLADFLSDGSEGQH